ncbi:MAG: hypothetical protein AAB242_10735, partial [Nitrospirota bacterium]
FLDQLTRAQDPDDLPLASCRRTSQLDLARAQQIEAQTQVAFVEDGLVRLVIEGAFDFLKFGEVVSFDVAQHHLRAKRAGVAILDETGLPFHDLPIIVAARHLAIEQYLEASRLYIALVSPTKRQFTGPTLDCLRQSATRSQALPASGQREAAWRHALQQIKRLKL